MIDEGTPAFHLDDRDRCVFLNQKNLCDIYIELGEDALCEICTQHPRFHNEYGNIRQTGLGMACEEATRLMFEGQRNLDYARFRERIQSQRMTLMNQF